MEEQKPVSAANTLVTGESAQVTVGQQQPEPAQLVYLRLLIPAFFSLLVIGTCSYKIITGSETDASIRTVWWSTLAGTAASWMPSAANAVGASVRD